MLDAILFEKRGIPAAVVITQPFVPTAQAVARMQQMPDYPFIVVPHPITSLTLRQAEALADAITDEVEAALLQTGAPSTEAAASAEESAAALTLDTSELVELEDRLAAGIRADGGELTVRVSEPGEMVVTLSIPDDACAECILPKSHLESVFFAIVAEQVGHGWQLKIQDPREPATRRRGDPPWSPT